MAKGTPANDVAAAAQALRDGARVPGSDAGVKVDVTKVLDRIAAALAALDEARVPKRARLTTKPVLPAPAQERPRLRHNWG